MRHLTVRYRVCTRSRAQDDKLDKYVGSQTAYSRSKCLKAQEYRLATRPRTTAQLSIVRRSLAGLCVRRSFSSQKRLDSSKNHDTIGFPGNGMFGAACRSPSMHVSPKVSRLTSCLRYQPGRVPKVHPHNGVVVKRRRLRPHISYPST